MPYPQTKTWTFNLGDLAEEASDLEVTVRDNVSLPASTQSYVGRAQAVLQRIQKEAKKGNPVSVEDEWALSAPQRLLDDAIMEWNLPYPDDHAVAALRGTLIPLRDPATEPDPFGAIPSGVYAFILGKVMARLMTPSKSPKG